MTSVPFPLIPGQPDVHFRFTIATACELDDASQHGVQVLLSTGKTTKAIQLMTCYGLKHADHRMTEAKATNLIQRYVDAGGDMAELMKALTKALQVSGVLGKVDGGDEENPTTATTTEAETKTA